MNNIMSIVIPAYNEENGIEPVIESIKKQEPKLKEIGVEETEIIVVDDGSKDKTVEKASNHEVRVIEHEVNQGYGAALKTGFENAKGDVLAFLDADGTYPPQCFPDLLKKFLETDADMILGSRISNGRGGMPLIRYIGNKFFAYLLSVLGNTKVSDTGSGMRIFKRSILNRLYPLPDDLEFTPAMSTKSIHEGIKMVELPIKYEEREGDSKLSSTKHGWRFLKVITYNTIIFSPLKLFGTLGILMIILSILIGYQQMIFYVYNFFIPERYFPLMISGIVLFIAGINLIFFGISSNSIVYHLKKKDITKKPFNKYLYSPEAILTQISIGAILILAALILNLGVLFEGLPNHVYAGSLLFLSGLNILTMSILNKLIKDAF